MNEMQNRLIDQRIYIPRFFGKFEKNYELQNVDVTFYEIWFHIFWNIDFQKKKKIYISHVFFCYGQLRN